MSETPTSAAQANYREAIHSLEHGAHLDFQAARPDLLPYDVMLAERLAAELAEKNNANSTPEVLTDQMRALRLTKDVVTWRSELVEGTIALDEEPAMFTDRQKDYGLAG